MPPSPRRSPPRAPPSWSPISARDAAAAVAERISAAGGKADSVALDVSDRGSAEAAAAQAAGLAEGKLHILVNNAGVTAPAMFPKLTDETFRLTFDIHVMGTFHCAQAALPHMPTDGTGRIINVTSVGRAHRHARSGELLGRQGRHHRVDQVARPRTGDQEHPGERARPAGGHAR